jgi:hypothetical protein
LRILDRQRGTNRVGGFGPGALRRRDIQRDELLDALERLALQADEDFEIGLVGAHELFSIDHGASPCGGLRVQSNGALQQTRF